MTDAVQAAVRAVRQTQANLHGLALSQYAGVVDDLTRAREQADAALDVLVAAVRVEARTEQQEAIENLEHVRVYEGVEEDEYFWAIPLSAIEDIGEKSIPAAEAELESARRRMEALT